MTPVSVASRLVKSTTVAAGAGSEAELSRVVCEALVGEGGFCFAGLGEARAGVAVGIRHEVALELDGQVLGVLTLGLDDEGGLDPCVAELLADWAPGLARRLADVREHARGLVYRDQVMGILGHDLRNPLTAVLGIAGLGRIDASFSTEAREHLEQIERAARRMREMIEVLLDFSQTRFSGKLPITACPTDLRTLCERVIAELAIGHAGRSITLHVENDTRGHWDTRRIAQVVSILVANALTHDDPPGPVRVSLRGAGERVRIAVHNQGRPIAPEVLPVLFEPFTRVTDEKLRPRGLGLGLYITRQIVLAHGGAIVVRSTVDEGTTFTVDLPRRV